MERKCSGREFISVLLTVVSQGSAQVQSAKQVLETIVILVVKSCRSLCRPGLQLSRLHCPWDFPGKNTGVGSHFLLKSTFPTQGLNLCLLHQHVNSLPLSHLGSPRQWRYSSSIKMDHSMDNFVLTFSNNEDTTLLLNVVFSLPRKPYFSSHIKPNFFCFSISEKDLLLSSGALPSGGNYSLPVEPFDYCLSPLVGSRRHRLHLILITFIPQPVSQSLALTRYSLNTLLSE